MANSPFSTPKRKRSEMLNDGPLKLNTTTQFTFDVNSARDDGGASPRSRVAHKFRGLALGGGVGSSGPSADQSTVNDGAEESSRKRVRLPDVEMTDADSVTADSTAAVPTSPARFLSTQAATMESSPSSRPSPGKSVALALDEAVVEQIETVANASFDNDDDMVSDSDTNITTPSLTPPSPPPAARRPQPRRRGARRPGTPPPTAAAPGAIKSRTKPKAAGAAAGATTITDPLRASLTWHDDEITIYDPDDSNDDGTGINGIGFKPTPAIAYARALRRRQQLAEYRKREEREARAKRSLRRRGGSPAPSFMEDAAAAKTKTKGEREKRRVRFMEMERERERDGGVGMSMGVAGGELIGV